MYICIYIYIYTYGYLYMCIYLYIYLSIYLSISIIYIPYLSIDASIQIYTYNISEAPFPFTGRRRRHGGEARSIYLSMYVSIYLYYIYTGHIYPSIYPDLSITHVKRPLLRQVAVATMEQMLDLSIYLSIYLSISIIYILYLPVHLSIQIYNYNVYEATFPPTGRRRLCLSVYVYIYLSICLSIFRSLSLSIYPSLVRLALTLSPYYIYTVALYLSRSISMVYDSPLTGRRRSHGAPARSIYLSIYLSIHLSIYVSIYLYYICIYRYRYRHIDIDRYRQIYIYIYVCLSSDRSPSKPWTICSWTCPKRSSRST